MSTRKPAGLALVAFSFSAYADPDVSGPCNERLADEVVRIARESEPDWVVAQREVAQALKKRGVKVDHVVTGSGDLYLDCEAVWKESREWLKAKPISTITPIAQPFLQLRKVRHLIRKDGFALGAPKIRPVGFDDSTANVQWWTKGRARLVVYAALQLMTGRRGR